MADQNLDLTELNKKINSLNEKILRLREIIVQLAIVNLSIGGTEFTKEERENFRLLISEFLLVLDKTV